MNNNIYGRKSCWKRVVNFYLKIAEEHFYGKKTLYQLRLELQQATTQVVVGASLLDIGKLIKKISRKQNCTIIKI